MSRAAVTKDGSTDSFRLERIEPTAEGVNGEVMAKSESLVTCDLRAVDDAERRGSASLLESSAEVESPEGDDKVKWNCSTRVRVVVRVTWSFGDILTGLYTDRCFGWARTAQDKFGRNFGLQDCGAVF